MDDILYLPKPYEVIDKPLWWHLKGLRQTASGYGSKITSSKCIKFPDGKIRRIYVTIYSNIGTAWVIKDNRKWIVND